MGKSDIIAMGADESVFVPIAPLQASPEEFNTRYLDARENGFQRLKTPPTARSAGQKSARNYSPRTPLELLMSTTTTTETPRSPTPSSGRGLSARELKEVDGDFRSSLPPTPPTPNCSGEFYDKFDPRVKRYTPGPGSYQLRWDRKGNTATQSYSFGGSDRSYIKAAVEKSCSPGPKYKFGVGAAANRRLAPSFTVQHDSKWARSFTNSPCHNPGAGEYTAQINRKGGRSTLGDAPRTVFGSSSHHGPEESLPATMYLGGEYEVENHGVFSPGPVYYPKKDRQGGAEYGNRAFTMRPRHVVPTLPYGYGYKEFRHHGQEETPCPGTYDFEPGRRGGGQLGDTPKYTFRGKDFIKRSEENLSTVPFVSEFHSKIDNHGVHSPGPFWYSPERRGTRMDPNFDRGQGDRFYDRFFPGRL